MHQKLKYKHLFFDLDHTLWDFEANSEETLKELYDSFQLSRFFADFNDFHTRYEVHNLALWQQYRKGTIKKHYLNVERFLRPFGEVDFDDPRIAADFAEQYINISPTKTKLFPDTLEVLEALKQKYKLYIITNGFREVQTKKLKNSGLEPYFDGVYISDLIGVQKPHPYFFEYAIKSSHANPKECLVIGDSLEADIKGAQKVGLDHVFFNSKGLDHTEEIMHEINTLKELLLIL